MKTPRNAAITGGGSGLGAAAIRKLHSSGAKVVIADIDESRAQALALELDPSSRTSLGVRCDITQPDDCETLIARAEGFFDGPVQVFLANAGAGFAGSLTQADPLQIKRVIDTNLTGSVMSARAALRSMLKGRDGVLLFTSSLQGVMARSQRSIYTATKHGIIGLVKALALEYGPHGIRVNSIAPASTDTAFLRGQFERLGHSDIDSSVAQVAKSMPLGHLPDVSDFAEAVLFLSSSAAKSITGHTLVIDCGASAGRM
ncbi:SDR family oxidoreductase [Castellaniella sp. GW247-6E4]|uniref:SDR family NAD(P)-dependent oxidoreductase n=1 Tax=Castellaniella sp. GW247-6E4 TaxID=3140380 RepID=UPI003314FB49